MAKHLLSRDLISTITCIEQVHAEPNADRLPTHLLSSLCRLVPCKLAGFTQVDPVFGESGGVLHPSGPGDSLVFERFQRNIHEHPVVADMQKTRDGQARAISDFLSPRQFHATGLYREVFQPLGLEDQLSIGMVGQAGLIIGLSFNRSRRGFSDRDRAILNLMRPHVLQAYHYARELQLLRNLGGLRRGTIVDQLPIGLTCVDARGKVVWSTDPARRMMRDHFPDAADSLHGLPDAVRVWLRSIQRSAAPSDGFRHLPSKRRGTELTARQCPLADGHAVILFQERAGSENGEFSLERFGFTVRESQVMRSLMRGTSVDNVASQLQIARRTVEKHIERIFQKLGVTNLTHACLKVLRAC